MSTQTMLLYGGFTILDTKLEMDIAALALILRLTWLTYSLSLLSKGRGVMDFTNAFKALSASSHTNFLS